MFRIAVITIVLLLICASYARADAEISAAQPVVPETLWSAWNWDLFILLNLSLLGFVYLRGIGRLWRKAGFGRGIHPGHAAGFLTSLGVLFVALISPIHALSEELASAHMVQHMLLMVVAAPLFVVGAPGLMLTWGLPPRWRPWAANWRRGLDADALAQPWLPWLLYAAVLWLWHLPLAYQSALVDPLVHDAQHLSFFAAACLYWRVLLDPLRGRRLHPLAAVVSLFATSLHAMLLGVLMTLSPTVWYEIYTPRTAAWGLTPLEDQQLAGLIMWMPACLVYPAAAAVAFGCWLARLSESQARSNEQPLEGV